MKKRTAKGTSPTGLDPAKTKKILIAGVLLFVVVAFLLSFLKDQGSISDQTAIVIGCIFGAISFVAIVIDTLAQDKSTIMFRLIGLIILLVFAYIRFFA
ncbi:hypothetical protein ACX1C1_13125 [Paenibacillus sp. strain BS8-2]